MISETTIATAVRADKSDCGLRGEDPWKEKAAIAYCCP